MRLLIGVVAAGAAVLTLGAAPADVRTPETPAGLSASDWTQIRTIVAAETYQATTADGVVTARNAQHDFEAAFDRSGFTLKDSGGRWSLPVRFAGHGWSGQALIPAVSAEPVAEAERVAFRRGGVTEWYRNTPSGVEQGFTIAQAPAGRGDRLEVALDIGGGFTARPDGPNADLINGSTRIDYDRLVVTDARGRTLRSRMNVQASRITLSVDTRGAVFPIVVDPTYAQQAKLLANDKADGDYFGRSVALSGDTLVVGANLEDDSGTIDNGAAYVFTRSGGVWTQQAKLLANDKADSDSFGWSVALSGDTLVVGANSEDDSGTTQNGAAYVFTRSAGVWTQQAKLLANDKADNDRFGASVALSGDTVVVGANFEDDSGTTNNGAAYAFLAAPPPVAAVPTLSEWAMILLGLLLAGGAAIHLQRRRMGAN